jgi:hypothetical protein
MKVRFLPETPFQLPVPQKAYSIFRVMINITQTSASLASGTSLVGYIPTTYDTLVKYLGEPNYGVSGDGKVTCEWVLLVDGDICTIYDWKMGTTPRNHYKWHVGGRGGSALRYLSETFGWDVLSA